VNNIEYPDNTVSISVNKYTGEVSNYYANWDRDIVFPKPENIISLDEGKEAYMDKIGLNLMFKSTSRLYRMSDLNNEDGYYLAYSNFDKNKAIDAITGEPISLGFY